MFYKFGVFKLWLYSEKCNLRQDIAAYTGTNYFITTENICMAWDMCSIHSITYSYNYKLYLNLPNLEEQILSISATN